MDAWYIFTILSWGEESYSSIIFYLVASLQLNKWILKSFIEQLEGAHYCNHEVVGSSYIANEKEEKVNAWV